MKYIIERSTNSEMTKWLEAFFQHLKKTCEAFKAGAISLDSESPVAVNAKETPTPPPTITAPPVPPANMSNESPIPNKDSKHQYQDWKDYIFIIFVLLVIVFLIQDYFKWKLISEKVMNLESKLRSLETTLDLIIKK
jgi:hypothetical protein